MTAPALFDQIQEAAATIRAKWAATPAIGIILGTGLGKLTEDIQSEAVFPYDLGHSRAIAVRVL